VWGRWGGGGEHTSLSRRRRISDVSTPDATLKSPLWLAHRRAAFIKSRSVNGRGACRSPPVGPWRSPNRPYVSNKRSTTAGRRAGKRAATMWRISTCVGTSTVTTCQKKEKCRSAGTATGTAAPLLLLLALLALAAVEASERVPKMRKSACTGTSRP